MNIFYDWIIVSLLLLPLLPLITLVAAGLGVEGVEYVKGTFYTLPSGMSSNTKLGQLMEPYKLMPPYQRQRRFPVSPSPVMQQNAEDNFFIGTEPRMRTHSNAPLADRTNAGFGRKLNRLNGYERVLVGEYFRKWKFKKIQNERQTQRMIQEAERFNRRRIIFNAMSIWNERCVSIRELEEAAAASYKEELVTKTFKKWKIRRKNAMHIVDDIADLFRVKAAFIAWKNRKDNDEKIATLFNKSTVLSKWVIASNRRVEKEQLALAAYDRSLQKRHTKLWNKEYRLAEAERDFEQKRKQVSLELWKAHVAKVAADERTARLVHDRRLLTKVWIRWSNKGNKQMDLSAQGLEYGSHRLLSIHFEKWRKTSSLIQTEREFIMKRDGVLVHDVLMKWKSSAVKCRDARDFANINLLKSTMHQWLLRCRERVFTQKKNEEILRDSLHKWIRQERLGLVQRIRDRNAVNKVMDTWIDKTYDIHKRLRIPLENWEATKRVNLKAYVLRHWVNRYRKICDDEDTAIDKYNDKLASSCLTIWRESAEELQMREDIADQYRDDELKTQTLISWRKALQTVRKKRRFYAFVDHIRDHTPPSKLY